MRWMKLPSNDPARKLWKQQKKNQKNIDVMDAQLNPEWLYEKFENV